MEQVSLSEGLLFTIKDLSYSPEAPRKNDPFTVKGKVELFGLPFLAPVWVIVTVAYPETWWEEIIPIIGAPEVRESSVVIGGNFELTFSKGFIREGEYKLAARVYIGPTIPIDSLVLPPAPAFATEETTFVVAGTAPPQAENFRNFSIVSYSKGAGTPVTPPGVLDLKVGDTCRVNVAFDHTGPAVTGMLYSAIWYKSLLDPHNEVLYAQKSITVPATTDWKPYPTGYYVDIPITSAISKGTYGLYAKIRAITGADVLSPYLENVITIAGGGAVAEWVMVQEVSGISVAPEAVVPPAVWTMVQEVSGITVAPEAVAPPAVWTLVQEVSGISVAPEAVVPPAVWNLVQEVSGISVAPEAVVPPAVWTMVQEVSGISVAPEAVVPPPPVGWNLVQEVSGISVAPEAGPTYKLYIGVDNVDAGFVTASPVGTLEGDHYLYNPGTSVLLTAWVYNAAAYKFTKWLDPNNVLTSAQRTSSTITIQMNKDTTLTATYTYIYVPPTGLPPEADGIPTTPGTWFFLVFIDNSYGWYTAEAYWSIDPSYIKTVYGPYVVA